MIRSRFEYIEEKLYNDKVFSNQEEMSYKERHDIFLTEVEKKVSELERELDLQLLELEYDSGIVNVKLEEI